VLTEHSVAEAAAAAGLPAKSVYVASTGSTNADLMACAESGTPAWTVLVAGYQVTGRGRLGRMWVAPPGSSLLVSVLLRPGIAADEAPLVSLAAAVAMAEAVEAGSGVLVSCEWPNDLLTRSDGRKFAGILAESRIEDGRLRHVVIGVGVNLTQSAADFPDDLRLPATSLGIEGAHLQPEALLREFLERFHGPFDPDEEGFAATVLDAYRPRCATVGRAVRATTLTGETVEGRAVDVGPAGELVLATPSGPASVGFGDVERLD
jgi:BirA family biotin operon repressor/biotin-[acetyl-CoA-carboxylase] ligase